VAAAQLRLLSVFRSQFVSNTVQQLAISLLWVLLHRCDKGPGYSASSLRRCSGIGTMGWLVRKILKAAMNGILTVSDCLCC
jgi:hypothetical protein